jgi:hypothetical protein
MFRETSKEVVLGAGAGRCWCARGRALSECRGCMGRASVGPARGLLGWFDGAVEWSSDKSIDLSP